MCTGRRPRASSRPTTAPTQLRPVHQPLSRLRARLHLLLRPPHALLSRPLGRVSTSRPSSTPRSTQPSCSSASWPIRATCPSSSRSAPSPTPTSRSSASTGSRGRCWRCWSGRATRSASSPSRRWSCGTSISSARMASRGLAKVAISVTTLDRGIARKMEPRAATPPRRLEAIKALSAAGVPVVGMVAPIIPAINDSEIERILAAARDGWRQRGRLRAAAPAAGDQGAVPRVAAHRIPQPRSACHQHPALDARRQGLHARMGRAAARARALRGADRAAGSAWPRSAWDSTSAPRKLRTDLFQPPVAGGRPAAACFDSGSR